ncbi:TPM domain-containing protein [Sphingomonas sp. PR090111-T3T-6A]|uniref:TPM domain-containing protein n=1 Tax=Sphingomonas sp. PR090111-T3T-6A TaxID=685778 RepID=UPI00138AE3D8|nr:TPM domain-containing protein [Sphingomonas sp. PR090111-T3T-6A]
MTSSVLSRFLVLLLLALFLSTSVPPPSARAAAPTDIAFTGFVVDQASVLSPAERDRLTMRLDWFQQRTGHQFAVVTVDSLHGQNVALFTRRLANRWGVGRFAVNDGILLLIAPNEKKARIEVGRGLERRLTDPLCTAIMRWTIIPAIRRDGVAAGIDAGVGAIFAQFGQAPRRQGRAA